MTTTPPIGSRLHAALAEHARSSGHQCQIILRPDGSASLIEWGADGEARPTHCATLAALERALTGHPHATRD